MPTYNINVHLSYSMQIENEYANIEGAFGDAGPRYVKWAAEMAVGLNTGVPWTMCKQDDAPDPVVNSWFLLSIFQNNATKTVKLSDKRTCKCQCFLPELLMQINTCNGLNCGETFKGPNSPNKPAMWTENWTQQWAFSNYNLFIV